MLAVAETVGVVTRVMFVIGQLKKGEMSFNVLTWEKHINDFADAFDNALREKIIQNRQVSQAGKLKSASLTASIVS